MHGIDEGGLETGPSATAPVLYSTGMRKNGVSTAGRKMRPRGLTRQAKLLPEVATVATVDFSRETDILLIKRR